MRNALLSLLSLLLTVTGYACTCFLLSSGEGHFFGRNYDWITGNGLVCTNQRSLAKTSLPIADGKSVSWISRYGSVTFNQYGKEFPTGGMNEKGLVVELMWLDETQYPAEDHRPAVGALQWIQYQLDNAASIDEVIASDSILRISLLATPLHYLVADARGKAATIEFLNGKMTVHRDESLPYPVLTNSRYAEALQAGESSHADNSLQRFTTACRLLESYQAPGSVGAVDYTFAILERVSHGSHTKWSIVYDISGRKIHLKTAGNTVSRHLRLAALDFDCAGPSLALDISHGAGDITDRLTALTTDRNREVLERSAAESASQIRFSGEGLRRSWEYAGTIKCFQKGGMDVN